MRKFLIFPSKDVQREVVNSENKEDISKKFYLLSGKVCFYLERDKGKNLESNLILTAYQEGYFNPSQFIDESSPKKNSDQKKKPEGSN